MAQPATTRNATDRLSLRFLDDDLERRYQRQAGAESLSGYLLISLASAVVWAPAAFVLPLSTSLSPELTIPVGLGMSALSLLVALLARWATTLDRQHLLATLLTTANGTLIIALASIGGALPGYAVAAILAIFAWGFVSRTRFIFAALRTAVIALAFGVAVVTYPGPANLVLDVLLFAVGAVGVLLALHLVERGRRALFVQELVIREQADQLAVEMQKSTALIHNILPASVAERLLGGEQTIADDYPAVTVLFGDIVGFTPLSARLDARALIDLLGRLFSSFDRLAAEHGVVKIKTIGDAYMAVGGLTPGGGDQAAAVVRLGLAMLEEAGRHEALGQPLQLRIGVCSGPAVGGVIGTQRLAFDLWGDTVNVASRLQELAPIGRVIVEERTMLLIRDEFACEPLGPSELRGHSRMNTYAVDGRTNRVNIDLREGLVEVPGGLPTFASAGLEERARAIGSIASDSYEYLADLLGFRPQAQVLVVSEDDWPKVTEVPLYGLPNASNGTLAVAGTEAPFWSSFVEMAGPGAEAELATVYGAPDGVIRLGPFMDLIAVHEVAHLFHEGSQHFPRLWLQELFANVGLHAWVAERAPDQLTTLLTLPRLGAKASPETFDCRTRDDFERQYITMGGPNYVWFQFRLQLEAAALYDRAGSAVVRRLFEAFRLDDAALAGRLDADVDPGLAAFSLAF